jgi:hypothetical protein
MNDDDCPKVELMIKNLSDPPQIRLWVNSPGFTYEPDASGMKIKPIEVKGYKEEGEEEVSQLYIFGEMRGSEQQMLETYRLYFKANGRR